MLLIHRDRAVSAEALVEALFDEPVPSTAVQRLQVAVSRLRRTLLTETGEMLISTEAGGYRLDASRVDLDVDRLESALSEARTLLAARRGDVALSLIDEALALWRGSPLADVQFLAFAQPEVARLEELHRMALELRLEAMLACGMHDMVLPQVEALSREHPLHEGFRAKLMLALYRAGRHVDALASYREGRRLLADEMGLEPGPELRRLEQAILTHSPDLELASTSDGQDEGLPLPSLIAHLARRAFAGRRGPLHLIDELWSGVPDGRRALVFVSGPPGIGKTALSACVAQRLYAQGATVLSGTCDEEPVVPFQPFAEALRFYCRHRLSLVSTPTARQDFGEAGVLVPELRALAPERRASEWTGAGERYLLFDAVSSLLADAARRTPLLLVLDDLHWADRSTQLLLRHVVRNLAALPVLVLGMFRDDAPSELRQLVVDLERDDGASVIELDAFDERETGELIGSYAEATPPPDVVRRWYERTEGHPFFLHELLRQADAAALEATPDVDSPRSVTALIERQLSRAGGETAAVLATAAVIGHEFGLDLLAKVVGSSSDAALSAVERALATGTVGEVPGGIDRFSFAHALVRDHLYRSQTRSRRVRVHARIAEALEHDPGASPAERARHMFEARAVVGGDRAMRACEEAARSAAAAMAYDEASAYYRLALESLERRPSTDEARCELLLELGTMQWRAGEPTAEETFAKAAVLARERRDARQLALAALAGRHHETGFRDEPRVALLEEALAGLQEGDSVLRVRVLARLTENLHFVAAEDRALRMSDEALESARRLGDREALVAALLARHAAHLHIAHVEKRLEILAQLHALALETRHRDLSAHSLQWRIYGLLELGALDEAREAREHLALIASEIREPRYDYISRAWKVVFALLDHEVDEAERLAFEAHALAPRVQGIDANALVAGQLFFIRRAQGRLGELLPVMHDFVETNPLPAGRALLTLALAELGHADEARRSWEDLAAAGFSDLPHDLWWLTTLAILAETASQLHDTKRAGMLHELLAPYAHRSVQIVFTVHLGSVQRYLGLLAATSPTAAHRFDRPQTESSHSPGGPWGKRPQ